MLPKKYGAKRHCVEIITQWQKEENLKLFVITNTDKYIQEQNKHKKQGDKELRRDVFSNTEGKYLLSLTDISICIYSQHDNSPSKMSTRFFSSSSSTSSPSENVEYSSYLSSSLNSSRAPAPQFSTTAGGEN